MKIKLQNIGRIKDSEVEIKSITVITGANGSGKSTIGKALFGVFNALNDIVKRIKKERSEDLEDDIHGLILTWRRQLEEDKRSSMFPFLMREGYRSVVSNIVEEILKLRENEKDEYTEITEEGIKSICFSILSLSIFLRNRNLDGIDLKKLETIINDSQLGRIVEKLKISDEQVMLKLLSKSLNMEFNNQISNIYLENENNASIALTLKGKTMEIGIAQNTAKSIKNFQLLQEVFYIDDPFVVDELASFRSNDFYLLGHREILIQKLREKMVRVLDEIVGEQKLQEVEMLLNEVCEGQMEEDNGDFYYSSKKHPARLNIRSISTGMKTFVILKTLIQKGLIQKNGTVILDEPEIHLHPEWQVKLAEIIVVMQKALNLHILINTHSPYFLNAIETYVAKHNVENSKYYLAQVDDEFCSLICDVTENTEQIYQRLAEPFQILEDERWPN